MEMQPVSTIQNQVYQLLKEEICAGAFPAGQRLQEQLLAERFQVSRSPVREALRRLGADGLVEEIPNRGVFVKTFTVKDIEEIYEVRVMLESQAISRLSLARMEPAAEDFLDLLARLRQTYERNDLPAYTMLDTQLHRLLTQTCGNSLVAALYDRIDCQVRQFRRYSLTDPKRLRESVDEHEQIIRLLLLGNTEGAKEENCRHLLLARDKIIEYFHSLEAPEA